MTCKKFGNDINNQLCDTCINEFYFVEGTQNCFDEAPEGYYFDENEQKYKKCYETCQTYYKYKKNDNHNCITCKEGYTLFKNKNCLNCKSINKYVNFEQTECIDEIPDGYYLNDTDINTIDKCHPNCLTCKTKGASDNNMKCTSCDNDEGYFFFHGTKNCLKMPIPGYYIDDEDEIIKKCDISCAICTYRPIRNEDNEVINCDTCNKDLGFYNKDGNSTICINKTKDGEYYDDNCKCYKKCYKDCLTCSGEAIDQYHMNCLSCDSSKGYEFFSQTSNCLNCKSINKKVNYDQTECIDEIPDGYYINDTDSNTIDFCHENCLTCSQAPSDDNNQNCLSCKTGLYLDNGNCVKNINCPYKYYYKIKFDKNSFITEKICLKKDEICPSNLPFYYTTTNECVQSCPLDLLFYQGCKISNINYGINMFILIIRINYMQGLISSMSKSFSLYAFNNIIIKISISDIPIFGNLFNFRNLKSSLIKKRKLQLKNDNITSYQSLNDDNINKINVTNDFEGSNINLGDCEKKLREHYDIPDDTELTIIKLDFKKNDSKISQIQYEIFNPKNRSENLDLSICSKEKIKVINPIDITSNKLNNIIESTQNNIQFTDLSESLYRDICSQFLSENGAYVLTQDRMVDYNYEEQYCQKGCTMQNINITSGTVACLCPPMNGLGNITLENEEEEIEDNIYKEDNLNINNNKEKDKYNTQKYSYTNIKALKCITNIFGSGFSKNYILIIYTILLITYLILFTVSFFFLKKEEKNSEKNKNKANPPKNENYNKEQKDKKEKTVKKIKKGKKEKTAQKEKDTTGKKPKIQKIEINKGEQNSKEPIAKSTDIEEDSDNPDKMNFNEAKKDIKTFIYWLKHSLKKRIAIISILNSEDNSLILKIVLLILSFINYTAVNTLFFSEKNIHQIYLDNNIYNFSYQFKYIISSLFISLIFFSIAKIFYNNKDKSKNIIMKNKLMIAFIISSVIFIFYWVYIGAVTSLYINIKKHLIINIILCFVFDIIFEILLSLISATLRYTSFKFNKKIMFKISQIINLY